MGASMRRLLARYALVSLFLAGCGGGSSKPTTPTGPTASASIGTAGGTVASTDGTLQVVIPAGALPSDLTVTVTPTTSPGGAAVGTVYEIGPTGTKFAMPVTLTLAYDPTKLGGADPSMLRVATYASGSWQMLPGAKVDTTAMTVSGTTTHLSPYALVTAASGAVCAAISGGSHCDASSGPNGSGATVSCTPSTCADATNACAGYPGAKMMGCTEGANGFTATCCFDPGAPICFSAGGGAHCTDSGSTPGGGSGGTQSGGSQTTVTCPPAPTCATATAANTCAGYPGAAVQSCTDSSSGYTAACCFDPGAPVCVSVGAGSSCGGSSNGAVTCPPPPSCETSNPCGNAPGTTMSSCTDTTSGYSAVCCYAVGQLPPAGGTSSSGGTSSADAGVSSGGGGGASGGGSHGGSDASQPPPDRKDGGYVPPPAPDAGYVPPPPDGGYVPPPQKDGGPVPPPDDAGAQPCQIMTMPPSGSNSPCGVTEFCPSNGDMWSVRCQAPGTPCSCQAKGQQTGTVLVSCDPYDASALLRACGFPGG